jgi:hypothetical protein
MIWKLQISMRSTLPHVHKHITHVADRHSPFILAIVGYHGNEINKPLLRNGRLPNITHVGGSHKVMGDVIDLKAQGNQQKEIKKPCYT